MVFLMLLIWSSKDKDFLFCQSIISYSLCRHDFYNLYYKYWWELSIFLSTYNNAYNSALLKVFSIKILLSYTANQYGVTKLKIFAEWGRGTIEILAIVQIARRKNDWISSYMLDCNHHCIAKRLFIGYTFHH